MRRGTSQAAGRYKYAGEKGFKASVVYIGGSPTHAQAHPSIGGVGFRV